MSWWSTSDTPLLQCVSGSCPGRQWAVLCTLMSCDVCIYNGAFCQARAHMQQRIGVWRIAAVRAASVNPEHLITDANTDHCPSTSLIYVEEAVQAPVVGAMMEQSEDASWQGESSLEVGKVAKEARAETVAAETVAQVTQEAAGVAAVHGRSSEQAVRQVAEMDTTATCQQQFHCAALMLRRCWHRVNQATSSFADARLLSHCALCVILTMQLV